MSRIYVSLITSVFLLSFATQTVHADWSIDVESGLAFNGYNDVRIPGNTGTDLSLSEELRADGTGRSPTALLWVLL